jgi:hypothetical protein
MISGDVALIEGLLAQGLASPNAEMFVHDGRLLLDVLADAVHVNVDPGIEVEQETRGFMAFARTYFSENAMGRTIEESGMSIDEAARALLEGRFDPFAELDYPLRGSAG